MSVFAPPQPYVVGYSFSGYQAYNPSKPLPAPRLDTELAGIAQAIAQIGAALALLQRSDGALLDGVVTLDALGADVMAQFGLRPSQQAVTVAQFKHALSLSAAVGTVAQRISADRNDLANIQWTSGGTISPGDPLATLVQTALGSSAVQMAAFFARAAQLTTLLPMIGNVTVGQLKRALAVTSQTATVDQSVPADPNNLVNIQWTSGGTTGLGDPLAVFLATTLNLGAVGLVTLYQLAAQQTA